MTVKAHNDNARQKRLNWKEYLHVETMSDVQTALNDQFGKGKVKLLSLRQDGTINVKGLWEQRIKIRIFLKYKLKLNCLNKLAEDRGFSSTIGWG